MVPPILRLTALIWLLAWPAITQPKYCRRPRTSSPIRIDGRLEDAAWRNAPWTDDFVDIQGAGHPWWDRPSGFVVCHSSSSQSA
jgi:hypothetical protein